MVLVCVAIAFAMFPYLSQRLSRLLDERKHPGASVKSAPTQQVVTPAADQVPRFIPAQNKPPSAASVTEAEARAVEAYNQNPEKCNFCKAILPYSKRDEAFCNATCESNMKLKRKYDRQPNYCYFCGNAVPFEYRDSGFCSPECAEQYSQYLAQQQQSEMIRLQNSQTLSQRRKENQQHSNPKTLTSTDVHSGGLVFDAGGVQWAAP
jgi:predicted nucleic acid-binding Zn ribbon protein